MPKVELQELKTISSHQSYYGWPTVTQLDNGEILVVVSGGRERHVCPFGQVHLIRSKDNGKTWSAPEVLVNGPLDDRDAGVMQTLKGTILVNWFTSLAWRLRLEAAEAEGRKQLAEFGDGFAARCQKIRALLTENKIKDELGTWIIRSTDQGVTWSNKIDCTVGSPHGPTELADGRLLYVGKARADDTTADSIKIGRGSPYSPPIVAAVSEDDGCSWKRISEIPARPGDEIVNYKEPHAIQAPDGRILVHIRNHTEKDRGYILQSESYDGGKTFSVPHNIGLYGFPAYLLVLRDGRIITTYGYRLQPYGNRASISEDNGQTWSKPLILDEKMPQRDLGYPATTELADGTLLSVWYEKLPSDQLASVQMAKWSVKNIG